jgi:hypothetical protein
MTTHVNIHTDASDTSPINFDEAEALIRDFLNRYVDSLAETFATTTVPDPVVLVEYQLPAMCRYQLRSRAAALTAPGIPDDARAALRGAQSDTLATGVALLPSSRSLVFFQFAIPRFVWVVLFGVDSKGAGGEHSIMMNCPQLIEAEVIAAWVADFLSKSPGCKVTRHAAFPVTRAEFEAFEPGTEVQHEAFKRRYLGGLA